MNRSNFIASLVIGTAVIAAAPVAALTPLVRDLYLVFTSKEINLGRSIGILGTIYDSDENIIYRHTAMFLAPTDSEKIEWASHEINRLIPKYLRKRLRVNIYEDSVMKLMKPHPVRLLEFVR